MRLSRRRFLTITASVAALAGRSAPVRAATLAETLVEWRGTVLGAAASLRLHHPDTAAAERLVAACVAEVERLDGVFSLYRADSALSVLNRRGVLEAPPLDLVELLGEALRFAALTSGAFDPTVQPLWVLHAAHFSREGADPHGPDAGAVAAARELVDHRRVAVGPARIALAWPGMAITLNGIAQGFITDRVADLLRQAGMRDVLIDMGEIAALGRRPDGRPWSVGLDGHGDPAPVLPVGDRAVATSSPDGTRFSPLCHHLFDPATGRCADRVDAVTVVAPRATTADALSTALAIVPPEHAGPLLEAAGPAWALVTRAGERRLVGDLRWGDPLPSLR